MLNDALLFKGEDRANSGDMRLALHDLLKPREDWTINDYGKEDYDDSWHHMRTAAAVTRVVSTDGRSYMLIDLEDAIRLGSSGKFISCQCGAVLQHQVYIAQPVAEACDKLTQSFKEVVL
eukprot:1199-Heterococcus_DN1.PRE.3